MDNTNTSTLSIGVLTLNECACIRDCLRSARFADQLIVVDSGSSDGTPEIARSMGAEVYSYPKWQGFAVQRNRLIARVKSDYLFFLDADECITPALQAEIKAVLHGKPNAVWRVQWQMVVYGKPMRFYRAGSKIERLFYRPNLLAYEGVVHEQAMLRDPEVPRHDCKAKLLHHSRTSVKASLEKLTQYVMLGAKKRALRNRRGGMWHGIFSASWVFFRLYILRLAFTAGWAGFLYSFFVALEFFLRYAALHFDRAELQDSVKRGS